MRTVRIDTAPPREPFDALVVIDVLRATTTAVTALALGRRCLPVPTLEAAWAVAHSLQRPLLAGELGGETPLGFELDNSPAALVSRRDPERPMVLLSSSGTGLLDRARSARGAVIYAGCLRNARALADHLQRHHQRVALLGAPTRGEFRPEDRLCCARIAARLVEAGFSARDPATLADLARWAEAETGAIVESQSARWLYATGRQADLDFVLGHVDDLELLPRLDGGELTARPEEDHAASLE